MEETVLQKPPSDIGARCCFFARNTVKCISLNLNRLTCKERLNLSACNNEIMSQIFNKFVIQFSIFDAGDKKSEMYLYYLQYYFD